MSFNNELKFLEMEQETSRRVRGGGKAVSCVLCDSVLKQAKEKGKPTLLHFPEKKLESVSLEETSKFRGMKRNNPLLWIGNYLILM